jgi:hypothetical protein
MVSGITNCTFEELEDVYATVDSLLLAMNTDHCHQFNRPCEFLDLCANNLNDYAAEYIVMPYKHPELFK